ncbi:hypothetical protein OV203_43495 [Nannocystis sp. ILAH1]|uniref:hypothetical protein n=1 Tax=Nannocystis sp. ILAH1 TaxID=2996789 RepID=UPI002270BC86|nr:hypothetical protein [Nannocystis sp. ILAH1]MCY0994073.1 hypothetical protein [Nannocystis sp. ILAH1]
MMLRLSLAAALSLIGCGDKSQDTDTGGEAPTSEQCLAESQQTGCEALGCRWQETLLVPDETNCATSPGPERCFTLAGQSVGQARSRTPIIESTARRSST